MLENIWSAKHTWYCNKYKVNEILPCLQRPTDPTEYIDSFGHTAHDGWTIQYVRVIGTSKISKIMRLTRCLLR